MKADYQTYYDAGEAGVSDQIAANDEAQTADSFRVEWIVAGWPQFGEVWRYHDL